ncbi:hypothetical protein ZONE111904_08890 [Zobellia nedashkovskayae]
MKINTHINNESGLYNEIFQSLQYENNSKMVFVR